MEGKGQSIDGEKGGRKDSEIEMEKRGEIGGEE